MPTFVHTADVHFDSPFSARFSQKKAELRRREQIETFRRIAERAAGVNLFLISGDLFDDTFTSSDTMSYLKRCFAAMPQTQVIITAGNHDPLNEKSPYKKVDWSDNVHIMGTEMEYVDFPQWQTRVHGRSFGGQYEEKSLLTKLEIKDDWCNILVIHGEIVADGGKSSYNPLEKSTLENCGADYAALGHIHKQTKIERTGGVYFAYPGIPEGRGFDEDGDKGYIYGEVEKGSINAKWQSVCHRKLLHTELDVTNMEDSLQLLEAARKLLTDEGEENLYKLSLVGKCRRDFVNTELLTEQLKNVVFYIDVLDETKPDYSLEEIIKEGGIKADFILQMQKKIEQMDDSEKEIGMRALEIGLIAMEGGRIEW